MQTSPSVRLSPALPAVSLLLGLLQVVGFVLAKDWWHARIHARRLELGAAPALNAQEQDNLSRSRMGEIFLVPLAHDSRHARWRDIGGAAYAETFRNAFAYADARVRVSFCRAGPGFWGHIEADGLKPNFAYQIKLRGDYEADALTHKRLGFVGRWRLPGRYLNFSDRSYESYPDKSEVESYLFFDYFVTDADGSARRAFYLDSSLHVLWNDTVNTYPPEPDTNPREVEVRRKTGAYPPGLPELAVRVWAENEGKIRRRAPVGEARLPAGRYRCEFVLTEESFHDYDSMYGGYWATVLGAPIEFIILDQ